MKAPSTARQTAAFALLSGAPGLVYQVVWTREVALAAGSQIEAVSVVLVAFFGGLALGADRLGALADRVAAPLRLYGALEIATALAAAASVPALRALGGAVQLEGAPLLAACGLLLLPATFLLGGTLPALLRAVARAPSGAAGHAGWLVGANTVGAVAGVALAVASIPAWGLRACAWGASAAGATLGLAALALGRPSSRPAPGDGERSAVRAAALLAAAVVGAATLGYEVLASRLAALRLGSSLYAWGLVLGLFLAGLAAGNVAFAGRARRSARPGADLGWIEIAATCAVALGAFTLRPDVSSPATGLAVPSLLAVALGVLPAACAMGGAFPFLVRLAVVGPRLGGAFGRTSAVNTAGGIAGALLAPFALLPALGATAASLACAALNALVGVALLGRGPSARRRLAAAAACVAAAAAPALLPRTPPAAPWVLYVDEGRQATAVVTTERGQRALIVDGDPEAATVGNARRTEELLAVLPLLLHPAPRRFLELGLGSGITLGTARRFPLDRAACVEIAPSVIRAARYFEPDNGGVAGPHGAEVVHADARVFLTRQPAAFDVVAANTLHPWSVGATGLYSLEYFERIAGALAPGGIAVQWLPVDAIGRESMELLLRTFFRAFPHGALWWGADDVIAVGSRQALPAPDAGRAAARLSAAGISWRQLGAADFAGLAQRQIAGAATVRAALGAGPVLRDDRPVLERLAARRRGVASRAAVLALLVDVARAGAAEPGRSGAALLWLESLQARAAGATERADRREALAAAAGMPDAGRARASRRARAAHDDFAAGRLDAAARGFREALALDPDQREARFELAGLAIRRGDLDAALRELEALLRRWPAEPIAHNELSGVLYRRGDRPAARRAAARALEANPFYPAALANAGLLAAEDGDAAAARVLLARLRAVSPLGESPEERALVAALSRGGGGDQ